MFNSTIAKEGDINIVYLSGRLDAATAEDFTKILVDLASEGSNRIVLEMSDLKYISSNGLQPFLTWLDATRDQATGRQLAICCLQEFVKSVFEISGFDRKFPTFQSLESALETF